METPSKWLFIGSDFISKDAFMPIQNRMGFPKPSGGLWTSPFELHSEDGFKSDWQRWCHFNDFSKGDMTKGVVLTLKENTRFYIIDSQEDLINLANKYPTDTNMSYGMFFVIPNFEQVVKDYDVIYLTDKGRWETHTPFTNMKYNLYGWDCATGLILNYKCIEGYESIDLFVKEIERGDFDD